MWPFTFGVMMVATTVSTTDLPAPIIVELPALVLLSGWRREWAKISRVTGSPLHILFSGVMLLVLGGVIVRSIQRHAAVFSPILIPIALWAFFIWGVVAVFSDVDGDTEDAWRKEEVDPLLREAGQAVMDAVYVVRSIRLDGDNIVVDYYNPGLYHTSFAARDVVFRSSERLIAPRLHFSDYDYFLTRYPSQSLRQHILNGELDRVEVKPGTRVIIETPSLAALGGLDPTRRSQP